MHLSVLQFGTLLPQKRRVDGRRLFSSWFWQWSYCRRYLSLIGWNNNVAEGNARQKVSTRSFNKKRWKILFCERDRGFAFRNDGSFLFVLSLVELENWILTQNYIWMMNIGFNNYMEGLVTVSSKTILVGILWNLLQGKPRILQKQIMMIIAEETAA